jgi:hypothetical protein
MSRSPVANLPENKAERSYGLTAFRKCRWLKVKLVKQFEYVEWIRETVCSMPSLGVHSKNIRSRSCASYRPARSQ